MGKRKRPSSQALSHEEIWDDSALIRSWDEAVAEYEVGFPQIRRFGFLLIGL